MPHDHEARVALGPEECLQVVEARREKRVLPAARRSWLVGGGQGDIMAGREDMLHDVEWPEPGWRSERRSVVLLRDHPAGTSVAVAPAAPYCQAEGTTRAEALQHLRAAFQAWLADAEVTAIDVEVPGAQDGSGRHPW